jgi:type IV pilus assembly protein PilN
MIKINLLPYREEKRKEREKSFYSLLLLGVIAGVLLIIAGGAVIEWLVARQDQRNGVLKKANQELDVQIKEVSTLKQEILSLKARQQAVEDLQADRNQPVYMMDELVLQTPEGIYLKSLKQEGQRVVLTGYAQSNERVSEFLRNLSNNSPWLERPDLIEIKSVTLGQGKDMKKIFDFTINVGIKRPRDKDVVAAGKGASGEALKPAGVNPSASTSVSAQPAASAGAAKR